MVEEGFIGYIKTRKWLYIVIAFFVWGGWDYANFWRNGVYSGIETLLLFALFGDIVYLAFRAAKFLVRRWRYGKELEEWKAKEATPEYQEWFNSLTPEEQMVELQKKSNIIAEQTMKTSKTTTAASIFTAGAAGVAAEKVAKAVKK